MPVTKPGGKAWEKKKEKFDKNGVPLFNPDEHKCPISGTGAGGVYKKNTSGIPVAKIIT